MRLDRLLCERGIGSRKEARFQLRRGRVTVDGAVQRQADLAVAEDAVLTVGGEPLPPLPMVVAWHKPAGVVSTTRDRWGRRTLAEALPEHWRDHLHPVGRLDAETTGLLLFCRDGRLTQHLLHPRRAVPRTYEATVSPKPAPDLVARLAAGIETAAGRFTAEVLAIEEAVVRLRVREGKHRMVRRMLANAGHPVMALRRIAFGSVALGALAEGALRPLTADEVQALYEA